MVGEIRAAAVVDAVVEAMVDAVVYALVDAVVGVIFAEIETPLFRGLIVNRYFGVLKRSSLYGP